MEIPDTVKTQQDLFKWIENQLGNDWGCTLISTLTPGIVRLQLANKSGHELGFRKCSEGKTFEEALDKAIEFTHSMTVSEYLTRNEL